MNPFIILTFLEFLTRINPIESQSSFATVARLRDVKEEAKVCTFLNKNTSGSSRLTNNVSDFKMNIIKWKLHFVSCNFWCEIKLVLTNCTPASRSCNFVITRLISHQIALHSVQLPLLIH